MQMDEQHSKWTTVRASGEIDLSNVAAFIADLDEAAREFPGGFLIDLTEATYMDSAGVQAILNAYVRLRRSDGRIAVVTQNEIIISILRVISVDKLPGFFLCGSIDKAESVLREAPDPE